LIEGRRWRISGVFAAAGSALQSAIRAMRMSICDSLKAI